MLGCSVTSTGTVQLTGRIKSGLRRRGKAWIKRQKMPLALVLGGLKILCHWMHWSHPLGHDRRYRNTLHKPLSGINIYAKRLLKISALRTELDSSPGKWVRRKSSIWVVVTVGWCCSCKCWKIYGIAAWSMSYGKRFFYCRYPRGIGTRCARGYSIVIYIVKSLEGL